MSLSLCVPDELTFKQALKWVHSSSVKNTHIYLTLLDMNAHISAQTVKHQEDIASVANPQNTHNHKMVCGRFYVYIKLGKSTTHPPLCVQAIRAAVGH